MRVGASRDLHRNPLVSRRACISAASQTSVRGQHVLVTEQSPLRAQEHLAGKQFQGWLSIRKKLDELRQKLGPGGGGAAALPGPPPPSDGRSSRPSEPSRDRDRDRDRDYRRDRDNRDREREHRGHTSGSRDRDRCGTSVPREASKNKCFLPWASCFASCRCHIACCC